MIDSNSWRVRLFSFLSVPGYAWLWLAALICGFGVRLWWTGSPEEGEEPSDAEMIDYSTGFQDALALVSTRLQAEAPADPIALVRSMMRSEPS